MKNKTLKVLAKVLIGMGALSASMPAMAQVDAVAAASNETAMGGTAIGGANVTNAINLFFTGKTQAGAVAASSGAYVTISASAMTFYQPFGTVDKSVGTSGVITYASTLSTATLGGLCDYLSGLGVSYRCLLMGGKRDDPASILKTQTSTNGTNNLAAQGGFSVLQTTTNFVSLGITPGPDKRVILKQCVVNGQDSSVANNLYVYGQLRKFGVKASPFARDPYGVLADDTYNVWASSTAQNTNSTQPATTPYPWLEFAQNAHVVVRVGLANGGAGVQTSANFVNCIWSER